MIEKVKVSVNILPCLETEVWITDMPDHIIHLNRDKFLGTRKQHEEEIFR